MIIAVSKRMLQPKLTKEWIVYLKTLKPVLWSWPGSRLWPGGTGEQRCGMFCDARVLKVTDWVMWGIFAYWPSWSVSVNKELKPLYISSRTGCVTGTVWRYWRAQEDIVFHILNTSTVPPSHYWHCIMYHIPTPFKLYICVCTQHGSKWSQCKCSLPLLIFSKFLVREDCGCEIFTKRWH